MKLKQFQNILQGKNLDLAIFYTADSARVNPNLFYFSGYSGIGALIIPKRQEPFLIAPQMEFERAKKSIVRKVFSMEKKRFFESVYDTSKKQKINAKTIAIDKNNFTLNSFKQFRKQFKKIQVKDIAVDCLNLREIKTNDEIRNLKTSCNFAGKILQKAINNFGTFKTESECAAFLEYETKKIGLELSFNPIVASGNNASMPHHEPQRTKISKGFCVLDFGVKHRGYCSDITRTIYIGKPGQKDKKIYEMLLTIQENAINQTRQNKKCSELYDFVNNKLGRYRKNFTHGLGHGVGVEIHEMPNLSLNSKDKIANNMVFTIEPGVYFPGRLGIRIEDTVLFKDKPVLLTKTSKDMIIIN